MIRQIKLLIIALLLSVFSGSLHAQWSTEIVITTYDLNSIQMVNENSGWIVGDQGTMLYKYKDTWKNYNRITNEKLYSVFLIDENSGWAVGSKGTILRLDGMKWEKFESPTKADLYAVNFSDAGNGLAVGANGTVIFYENGNWRLADKISNGNLYTVSSQSNLSIIGGGLEYANIPVMTMYGNSEKNLVKSFDPEYIVIRSLAIQNQNNAWAVGSRGTIFHFNGSEWKKFSQFEKMPSLNSVIFYKETTGIAVGYSGTILTYSGDSWKKEESPVTIRLNSAAITEKNYYAVGDNGTIISLKRKTVLIPQQENLNSPVIKLASYPNPSADILNVIIPVENDFVDGIVTVTNSYGQIIMMEKLKSMTDDMVYGINTSKFSTGLYLIKITSANGRTAVGKFLINH